MSIELLHIDCMDYMAGIPDKAFDLAIVDPPFGIGKNWNKYTKSKFYRHESGYKNKQIPKRKYFKELMRVSRFQIIWGCNYYWKFLPPSNNLIFWDKGIEPKKHLRSAGNLAWTNITKYPFNRIKLWWCGTVTCEPRSGIHPHEMPIKLYRWLLSEYAEPGYRILDTHGGSMSIAIACKQMGFDLTLCELDEGYYKAGVKRFNEQASDNPAVLKSKQIAIL